jgi:hypothetical protein
MDTPSRQACTGLSVLLALTLSAAAQAFELPESVQIHGFLSQGYISTSGSNNFFGHSSDGGSWNYREIGVNGSWRPTPKLQFSMQVVGRDAGETDNDGVRIDYGFADYSFLSDADRLWGARVGRITNPLGFYNETRDVPFTRPSILLPQGIYFDINRNLSLSADGVQVYGEQRTSIGDFYFQAGAVQPRTGDPEFQHGFTNGIFPGELDGRLSWVGRALYERDGGRIRLAVSGGDFRGKYEPEPWKIDLQDGRFRFVPLIFSAQYNAEKWSLTSEFAPRRTAEFRGFGPFLPDGKFTGQSFYIQGTYRFAPKWEVVLRYDDLRWDKNDRNGKDWEAATGFPAHTRFAKDWTVGLRWDITPRIMLRAEYHRVKGTGWLAALENPGMRPNPIVPSTLEDDIDEDWNLFALLASFRF